MCFISVLGEVFHSPMFSQSVYLLTTFIYGYDILTSETLGTEQKVIWDFTQTSSGVWGL